MGPLHEAEDDGVFGGDQEWTSDLHRFTIRAKKATYVGDGAKKALSSRPGSHDLTYTEGDWLYRDSYFGGTGFLGQLIKP